MMTRKSKRRVLRSKQLERGDPIEEAIDVLVAYRITTVRNGAGALVVKVSGRSFVSESSPGKRPRGRSRRSTSGGPSRPRR